ncbi:hypothetical protein R3P38DRAFT_3238300 [Favolaschia claudopus]|uniref:Uncharacterized protein n=1 Tax=Favolaschia claudopus TaxID=2862362 RepID=A0AAV9Z9M2_9AGAR
MKLSLIINGALVLLLAMTNQGRLAALSEWIYSSLCSSFTIPAILALYGLVLIYLLVSVYHLENTTENSSTGRRRNRLVPYYNSEGQLQGWVREEKSQNTRPATSLQQPIRNSQLPISTRPTAPSASAPAKQTTPLPLPQPTASATPRLSEATPFSALASWDGFPDGRIKCHFTPQQVADTSQLVIYWAADKLPGKRGSPTAATPERGNVSRFNCAGVIECDSKVCLSQIAPGADIQRQLQSECTCGSKLFHRSCRSQWSIARYINGAVFESNHIHTHARYTHLLVTPKSKPSQIQPFISMQPVSLISSQPTESLNVERADSPPESSVLQRDEGEQVLEDSPVVEPQPQAPQHEPVVPPQNAATASDEERMMDPDAN